MKRTFVTAFVTAALALSAPSVTARQQSISKEASGFVPDRLARVDAFIQSQVDAARLPGAVLLLARHGRIATLRAFGSATLETQAPMQTDSLFRMASASKIVTAAGVLLLAEEGRFALGDTVGQYLPEFRDLAVRAEDGTVRAASARLTIRDLLRHTTGFGYGADPHQLAAYQKAGVMPAGRDDDWSHSFTLERWSSTLAAVPLDREPGTRFEYGLGSDIAGALIERVSGQRLDEFLRQRIFAPLSMHDTAFTVAAAKIGRLTTLYRKTPDGFAVEDPAERTRFAAAPRALSGGGGWDMAGHGGLVTTATDYFRFLQMLLNRGTLDGARVLSRHSAELMFANHLAGTLQPERAPGVGFGFGNAVVVDAARYGDAGSTGLMWWAGSTNTRYWLDPRDVTVGLYLTQVLPFPYLDLMNTVMRLGIHALE